MNRAIHALVVAVLVVLLDASATAQVGTGTVRVSTSGTDGVGCGSVVSPCRSIQYAVELFSLGTAGVIQVAAGTYVSAQPNEVIRVQGRRLTIAGGYSSSFTQADPEANPVIIDGENARRGISVGTAPGIDVNELTLTGVTITRGRAPAEMSGAVLSHFGGGIDAGSAVLLLIGVDFVDNHAFGDDSASGVPGDAGGGGVNLRNSTAFLSQVTFDSNSAEGGDGTGSALRGGLGVGGALYSYDSRVTLNGITATNNTARAGDAPNGAGADGGGQRADGLGGFWALILGEGSASHVTATGNLAEGGQAGTLGGLGIGGAIFIEATEAPGTLRSLDLRDNLALGGTAGGPGSTGGSSFGGAIFATDARLAIETSRLIGNTSRGVAGVTNGGIGVGGAISTDSTRPQPSELVVNNTVVARNAAEAASGGPSLGIGGGIFLQCPQATLGCPVPSAASSTATLRHVTFAENSVSGGLYNQGAALYAQANSQVDARYCIVSGHAGPAAPFGDAVIVRTPATVHFEYTLWSGNTLNSFVEPPAVFEDVSPLTGLPVYVNPGADPPDFHIAAGSAAIDQATGSATRRDLDDEVRSVGAGAARDVGADELVSTPAAPIGDTLLASVFADGTLLEVDPVTGATDARGAGPLGLVGLASREGRLFGLWEVEQLIELDPATGAAIATTRPGIGIGQEGDVAIRDDGRALATRTSGASSQLWSFDGTGSSAPTLLQPSLSELLDGMAFAPGGNLFGLTQSGSLVSVDANTGAVSPIGATGLALPGTAGITFSSNGTLYAVAGGSLYTVDASSAAPTLVGSLGNGPFAAGGISGIAFVPEPGTPAHGLIAVAVVGALRMRRRSAAR